MSISSTFKEQFLHQYSCAKKLQSQNVQRKKNCANHFHAKNVKEIDKHFIYIKFYKENRKISRKQLDWLLDVLDSWINYYSLMIIRPECHLKRLGSYLA